MRTARIALSALLVPGLSAALLSAQCEPQWETGQSVPGLAVIGNVLELGRWDPDGSGPLGPRLVCTGHFAAAGDVPAQNIVAFDPATGAWSNFGPGISGTLEAALGEANGGLVIGGSFSTAGGSAAANLARWNGSSWQALGSGTDGPVWALAAMPNGDVIAGGSFNTAGGQALANLARCDGTQWSSLGASPNGAVGLLARLPNGDLVAAGSFQQIGGQSAGGIARWDGTTWHAMGAPSWSYVLALAVGPSGELCVAGAPTTGGIVVASWTGATWQSLGSADGFVQDLGFDAAGRLHAAGSFSVIGGVAADALARLVNGQWQPIPTAGGTTLNQIECWPSGELFVGGPFIAIGGVPATGLGRWDGSQWRALAGGSIGGYVSALHERANGDVVLGGTFQVIDGVAARGVASWNGTTWQALGTGWQGTVRALAEHQGDLVVGGFMQDAATFPNYRHVARWDGTQWHSLGAGVDSDVLALLRRADGDLLVGGMFTTAGGLANPGLARWDGTTWRGFAPGLQPTTGSTRPVVRCLRELPNGDVIAGGSFRIWTGTAWCEGIARWDGTTWHAYGSGLTPGVTSIALLPNGDLVAGGSSTAPLRAALWNGTQWLPMGTPLDNVVSSVCALPDGSVAVGGYFTAAGTQYAPRLMRWNPASGWNWFGGGVDDFVGALLLRRNGDLLVGGAFTTAGGHVAKMRTSLRPPCRATAVTLPHGCTAAPTPRPLVVEALPWTGGTFRARASGLTPGSLALTAIGVATAPVPLTSLVSFGAAGCQLQTTLAWLAAAPTTNGTFTTAFPLPNSVTFAGIAFRHQVFELTAGSNGSLGELRSNDALQLVVGSF